MQYIGEHEEDVSVDSDFVLKKAVQRAIQQSYYLGEKEVTLRLLVFAPPPYGQVSEAETSFLSQYQCIECGGTFLKDTRFSYPQGEQPICNNCFSGAVATH